MKHKGLIISLAAFFAVMVVATVIAENVYYDSLPFVVVGEARNDQLRESFDLSGRVEYGSAESVKLSEFDFGSVALLANSGDTVSKETAIFSVPKDEILMLEKNLELSVETLKDNNKSISWDGDTSGLAEKDALLHEINQMKIDKAQEQIDKLQSFYSDDGVVKSGVDGQIEYLVSDGESVGAGQPIAKINSDTGERWVTWQLPAETGNLFGVGDSIDANLSVRQRLAAMSVGDVQVNAHVKLTIDEATLQPESQTYIIKASIPSDVKLDMADGINVALVFNYTSETKYENVLPTAAITFGSDKKDYVYVLGTRQRVYGEEYYVTKTPVDIRRSLQSDTALTATTEGAQYVFSSTKELADGAAVKLKEPEEKEESDAK